MNALKASRAIFDSSRSALYFSLILASVLLPLGRASSQTVDVQVWAQYVLTYTNMATNSLWVDGVLSQVSGAGDDGTNCGPTVTTPVITITMELNREYDIYHATGAFCEVEDSKIAFSGIPSCVHLWYGTNLINDTGI